MSAPPPFAAYLLTRIRADLAFLNSQQLINDDTLRIINQQLYATPAATGAVGGVEKALGGLSVGGGGPGAGVGQPPAQVQTEVEKPKAKALWDYTASQPDDLPFRTGDIITIEEEVNGDWWKGSLNGRTGLFPSNHVERLPPSTSSTPAPAYNPSYAPPPPPQQHNPSYASPPATSPYAYAQPQNYGSEKHSSFAPPPPPVAANPYAPPPAAPAPQYVVQDEQQKKKFPGGKFGKQMGTAFAGGMGFGAGSAVASNAINSIF
ncbi:hypothetical protein JCM10213_002330 [Rhodosporidiobolus nylandii]